MERKQQTNVTQDQQLFLVDSSGKVVISGGQHLQRESQPKPQEISTPWQQLLARVLLTFFTSALLTHTTASLPLRQEHKNSVYGGLVCLGLIVLSARHLQQPTEREHWVYFGTSTLGIALGLPL